MGFHLPSYDSAAVVVAAVATATIRRTKAGDEDSVTPRANADAALHRAETLIAEGGSDRAIGFLLAAKARCACVRA